MWRRLFHLMVMVSTVSCIEPFEIKDEIKSLESLLVVEAKVTDKMKNQTVLLSRSASFGEASLLSETGASVQIIDDNNVIYQFIEQFPGSYISAEAFAVKENVGYQLQIVTGDGEVYESDVVFSSGTTKIDRIYAEPISNETNGDGIGIFIDSDATSSDARFYRYEYEETYKIIAPEWRPFGFEVFTNDFGELDFRVARRTEEQRVCYNTVRSNQIIQADTEDLVNANLSRFLVRSISRDNFIISHRYSILIRQVLQSPEAFDFFRQLKDFSSSDNVFSNVQPGFITGNIRAVGNEKPVLGFFELQSVSEERLFFNYEDFYPDESLPPYAAQCRIYTPSVTAIGDILDNRVSYISANDDVEDMQLPYFVTPRPCGDCTALGSNIVPDFWIE